MKKIVALCTIFLSTAISLAQENPKKVYGTISDDFGPLKNVSVQIEGTEKGTVSDSGGKYEIKAQKGETLVYSHMGMKTVKIKVEDVTRVLNVKLPQKVEELDEVTVSKTILKSQKELEWEYDTNPNVIKTAFGFMDKSTSNFSLRIIGEEEVDRAPNLNFLVNGRFAGVYASCRPDTDEFIVAMRPANSLTFAGNAIFDVDGQILTEVNCSWLNGNVRRIAFIPSYAALTRYGAMGKGGVVIINTKAGTVTSKENDGKPYDRAKLRNNFYDQKALGTEKVANNAPQYIKDLYASPQKSDAIALYEKNARAYSGSYWFTLDNYQYFMEQWNDQDFADKIISDQKSAFENNPVALKALAYNYESEGRWQKAHEIYKEVYTLRPEYAQSFIDMANSYRNLKKPEAAASLYARHSYLLDEGLLPRDTVDLAKIMERELENLFALDNGTLKINKRKALLEEEGISTRLVFEWNDSEAEFDLQFVNPENQYFQWKHTMEDMPDRIYSEKELGYSMADFLLDDKLPGTWTINVTYLGNKQLTPAYLKVTVYRNYGSKLQSKEVEVFKLGLTGSNQHLFNLKLPSEVVHN
ncbi:MAG: hypothetical protein DSY83_04605 [Flavobacteriia bacterium]|nr:MAG: hypothetical protein DSY83_04605 [Flavobacteriia bacterium]